MADPCRRHPVVPLHGFSLKEKLDTMNTVDRAVIYTPGDNEWTDCHTSKGGGYPPARPSREHPQNLLQSPNVQPRPPSNRARVAGAGTRIRRVSGECAVDPPRVCVHDGSHRRLRQREHAFSRTNRGKRRRSRASGTRRDCVDRFCILKSPSDVGEGRRDCDARRHVFRESTW